jgi:hypothetical protein
MKVVSGPKGAGIGLEEVGSGVGKADHGLEGGGPGFEFPETELVQDAVTH